jgi:hypothetical protein
MGNSNARPLGAIWLRVMQIRQVQIFQLVIVFVLLEDVMFSNVRMDGSAPPVLTSRNHVVIDAGELNRVQRVRVGKKCAGGEALAASVFRENIPSGPLSPAKTASLVNFL